MTPIYKHIYNNVPDFTGLGMSEEAEDGLELPDVEVKLCGVVCVVGVRVDL